MNRPDPATARASDTADSDKQAVAAATVAPIGRPDLDEAIRAHLRRLIEENLKDELDPALGVGPPERGAEQRGYRHGARECTLTYQPGVRLIAVPRGRFFSKGGCRVSLSVLAPPQEPDPGSG